MRKVLLAVGLLCFVVPAWAQWSDNFDSYPLGALAQGTGGWRGWNSSAAAVGIISNAQSLSAPQSMETVGATDAIHEYTGYTSGTWTYTAKVYVPNALQSPANDGSYFIMLSRYSDNASNNVWTVQARFNPYNDKFEANAGSSAWTGLPYVADQWAEIKVKVYLDQDWTQLFYNGTLIDDPTVPNDPVLGGGYKWSKGVDGSYTGPLAIGCVDLFSNNSTSVYFDDISLVPEPAALGLLALGLLIRRR